MRKIILITAIAFLGLHVANAQYSAPSDEETHVINAAESSPDDVSANYNAAIHYYNAGVENLGDGDLIGKDLHSPEYEEVGRLFIQALPYAERAYHLDPENREVVNLLMGIYFGLNDMPRYDELKRRLEE